MDSNQSPRKAFLFFQHMKAEKFVVSTAQLYKQSADTEGQKEILFWGLFKGGPHPNFS